jgi:ribokinase
VHKAAPKNETLYDVVFVGHTTRDVIGVLRSPPSGIGHFELERVALGFGGKAANAAGYCSATGARVAYVGAVGNDFDSSGYRDYLRASLVNVDDVFHTEHTMPVYIALNHKGGAYSFAPRRGWDTADCAEALRQHVLRCVSSKKADSIYCALGDPELEQEVLACAKGSGRITAWNPASGAIERHTLKRILCHTNILFANKEEAQALEDCLSVNADAFCETFSLDLVCITLGADGCRIHSRLKTVHVAGDPLADIVDPTGAGDAFAGTFLGIGVKTGFTSVSECAAAACRVAEAAVLRLGAVDMDRGKNSREG